MTATPSPFPPNYIDTDYDPQKHLIQLKGRDYLNVQQRLQWFVRDQRALIAAGTATVPYTIQTELIEHDRQQGWAHFRTTIRDVLGNEATMYGSESARDFPDYIEKASTKSLGRALLLLGYGTAFAIEMDEGERVVDAPMDRPRQDPPAARPAPRPPTPPSGSGSMATVRQIDSIRKLCTALGREEPDVASMTFVAARALLTELSAAYTAARQAS